MLRKTFPYCFGLSTVLPVKAQDTSKAVFGGYSWTGGNFHGWNSSVTGNLTAIWIGRRL